MVEFYNTNAKAYISPKLLATDYMEFNSLWPENNTILEGIKRVTNDFKSVQIQEHLYNYETQEIQNIQITLYPFSSLPF